MEHCSWPSPEDAHAASIRHRTTILQSRVCGCFYCVSNFPPDNIIEWTDSGLTALCPRCGIDAVIGSESGFPVEDIGFLRMMNKRWFWM